MPITIRCPSCTRNLSVPEKYMGQRVSCPNCKGSLLIPTSMEASMAADLESTIEDALGSPHSYVKPLPRTPAGETPNPPQPPRVADSYSSRTYCPFCDEEISASAKKCKHCGEYLDPILRDQHHAITRPMNTQVANPGVAAVLSLVIPGAGQMYKGHVGTGFVWLACVAFGYLLIVPGLVLHIFCIIDAASTAKGKFK